MDKTVIELFAGVGGFRVGLNNIKSFDKNGKAIEQGKFKFVWANQWEPSTKCQPAFECYKTRFGDDESQISNEDITKVDKKNIPDHSLLCGGFPCQDYSVARSLSKEQGIEGKKGVLWWQIYNILKEKNTPFVLLENVDRLIKSPSTQRGRDFGIILRCFNDLNYSVMWRVINAADYGHPQRRRRIFIFAYKNTMNYALNNSLLKPEEILLEKNIFSKKFPIVKKEYTINKYDLITDYNGLLEISNEFTAKFDNSGYMSKGIVYTAKVESKKSNPTILYDIVESTNDEKYYLSSEKIKKIAVLRGSKSIPRISKLGIKYNYSEGKMSDYDDLLLPGRTMLTSEGTMNRSTHVIFDPYTHRMRILTPIECERLNQFPDNWTDTMNERKRYFVMGNALVCGVVNKIGKEINKIIELED